MMARRPIEPHPVRPSLLAAPRLAMLALAAGGLFRCDARHGCSAGCGLERPTQQIGVRPVGSAPTVTSRLGQTVVLPSLDTPIPKGKNAIWHIGTPLAWNQTERELPTVHPSSSADPVARRMRQSPASPSDVDPRSLLLAFGPNTNEFRGNLRRLLAKRFPGHEPRTLAEVPVRPGTYISFAFLALTVPFGRPYQDQTEGLSFLGADGRSAQVRAFGLGSEEKNGYEKERRQVRILYSRLPVSRMSPGKFEYAVDLDRRSKPYQLVLARIPRPETLAEGYQRVLEWESRERELWIKTHGKPPTGDLDPSTELIVPNQDWDLLHRHRELEKGSTQYFGSRIRFLLDRSGSRLTTEALEDSLGMGPPGYLFDAPFLLYIRLRSAPRPCFVLWIDNLELLSPLPGQAVRGPVDAQIPPEADAPSRADRQPFSSWNR